MSTFSFHPVLTGKTVLCDTNYFPISSTCTYKIYWIIKNFTISDWIFGFPSNFTPKIPQTSLKAVDKKKEIKRQSHRRVKYPSHLNCSPRGRRVRSPVIFGKYISYSNTNGAICANSMSNSGADSRVCDRRPVASPEEKLSQL